MSNVTVIGTQWGDEGKGKIVDWLSQDADVIVRFQGGHNAGHTLVVDNVKYKLSLLPSGIVRKGKLSVIGNGVVLDLYALLREIEYIRSYGIEVSPQNLVIAENAALILPIHQALDEMREKLLATKKIDTTKRGIGPAYEDKVARRAVRLCDLTDPEWLKERIKQIYQHHNLFLDNAGCEPLDYLKDYNDLLNISKQVLPYSKCTWQILAEQTKCNKSILFEGAQGVMLDVDHGTYPYVTSSNTGAGQVASGAGVGPQTAGYVLGITKAYATRVGSGPFPSEQDNAIGQQLRDKGFEFGTVTGRKRRCGWFDAALVRQAIQINGINAVALTKLDILDDFEEIAICNGYMIDDEYWEYLPASPSMQMRAIAQWELCKGWNKSTHRIDKWQSLPANAISYIQKLEKLIGVPIILVSTGAERDSTILLNSPFDQASN